MIPTAQSAVSLSVKDVNFSIDTTVLNAKAGQLYTISSSGAAYAVSFLLSLASAAAGL